MKIGLSYSRCIKDIVDGTIDIDDVLVIVSRTDFDPHDDKEWTGIWQGYRFGSNPEWYTCSDEDEDLYRNVSIELWEQGKLHQPRKFGARPFRMPYYWLEASLPTSELELNPVVKKAWEQFQIVAGLSNTNPVLLKDNF